MISILIFSILTLLLSWFCSFFIGMHFGRRNDGHWYMWNYITACFLVLNILNLFDIMTTNIGLSIPGIVEQNPIASFFFSHKIDFWYNVYKVIIILFISISTSNSLQLAVLNHDIRSIRTYVYIFLVSCILMISIVIANSIIILKNFLMVQG